MAQRSTFPLLATLAVIISSIAEVTQHITAIVQVVVVVGPTVVHLLDPAHPFILIMLLVGVGLVLVRRARYQGPDSPTL